MELGSSTSKFRQSHYYFQLQLQVSEPLWSNKSVFVAHSRSFLAIQSTNVLANDRYFAADDTVMLWGIKYYNDLLMVAGADGNVQSELLFRKDPSSFTFEKGWAFPRRIYFNGSLDSDAVLMASYVVTIEGSADV